MKTWFEKGGLTCSHCLCCRLDDDAIFDINPTEDENSGRCYFDDTYVNHTKSYCHLLDALRRYYGVQYVCPQHSNICNKCSSFAKQYPEYLGFEVAAIANSTDVNATLKEIQGQRNKKPCYQDAINMLDGINKCFDWDAAFDDVKQLIDLYHLQWLKDNRNIILDDIKPFVEKFKRSEDITSDEDERFHNAIKKVGFVSFYYPCEDENFNENLKHYLSNTQCAGPLNWIDTSKI